MRPGIGEFLKQEVLGLGGVLWRVFWMAGVGCLAIGVAYSLVSYARHPLPPGEQPALWVQVVVGVAIGAYYGVFLAGGAAIFAGLWRLFGPSFLVVATLAPLIAIAVIWLMRSPISDGAIGFLDAVIASAHQTGLPHTAEAAGGMKMSCGGGGVLVLLLVLLSPFLIADLALILAKWAVLAAFLKFAAVIGLAIAGALLAAVLVASPLLLIALIRRGKRRYEALQVGAAIVP